MKELTNMILSGYGCILIPTQEWIRISSDIMNIEFIPSKKVYSWDGATGLSESNTQIDPDCKHPNALFEAIKTSPNIEDIIIIHNIHLYWKNNPAVINGLRDCIFNARKTGKSIILIQVDSEVPPELKDDITIMEYPLPKKEQIKSIISRSYKHVYPDLSEQEAEEIAGTASGLSLVQLQRVLGKLAGIMGKIYNHQTILTEVMREKKAIIKDTKSLSFYDVESIDPFMGYNNVQNYLNKCAKIFNNPLAKGRNIPEPKGILLAGFPGCGKSLAAKTAGKRMGLPVIHFNVGAVFGQYVGQSEGQMREALKVINANSPCVIWLDEIEKAIGSSRGVSDGGTSSRVIGQFLTWMEEQRGAFIVATCNDLKRLPPEMTRKGRFDEVYFIDMPSPSERKDIWTAHLNIQEPEQTWIQEHIDMFIEASKGFTGAEIKECIIEAKRNVFYESNTELIKTKDILNVINNMIPLWKSQRQLVEYYRERAKEFKAASSEKSDVDYKLSDIYK